MGTKMQKLMTVFLLSLFVGLFGGSPASAQYRVDFTSKMKVTAADLEDKACRKEVQGSISKAEGELDVYRYMDCVDTAPKVLVGPESAEKK